MKKKKGTIDELMNELGLPHGTEFIGFCIHHEQRDEFLAEMSESEELVKKIWSKIPELAALYDSQREAEKVAKSINDGSVAGLLFDTGSHIRLFIP
jgi:hypothetical protein